MRFRIYYRSERKIRPFTILPMQYYSLKRQLKQSKTAFFYSFFLENFIFWRIFALEGFGLFHLLNTLLGTENANDEKSEEKTGDITPTSQANGAPAPVPLEGQNNACLAFFEAHDARAKKKR